MRSALVRLTAPAVRGFTLICVIFVMIDATTAAASSGGRASMAALSTAADLIITGRVRGIDVAWEREVAGIYTSVTVDVDRVLKGPSETQQVVIKQLGGAVAGEGMMVLGQAQFLVGEEVLLFLERRPRDQTLFTAGLWQGKWTLAPGDINGRIAVQQDPEGVFAPWQVDLEPLASAISSGVGAFRADAPLNVSPSYLPADQPFVFKSNARWLTAPVTVNVSGEQPGLTGGGGSEIAAAIAQWNAPASALRLSIGQQRPSRCLFVDQAAGDILITFNDPCGEISDLSGFYGYTWFYYTTAVGFPIADAFSNRIVQATITTDGAAAVRPILARSSCFQALMLHELGHAVGFSHTSDTSAVMFPTYPGTCAQGTLADDDRAGLFNAYPRGLLDFAPIAPPANVQVALNGGATLTVGFGASPGATSYQIDFRQTINGPVFASFMRETSPVPFMIPPGTIGTFNVSVTPQNSFGVGPSSGPVPFTIGLNCTVPAAVSGVSGGVSGGVATVRWNASMGGTSYIVQAGSTPGASNLFNGTVGSLTQASAAGLPPGFRAYVRIIPVGPCGQGPASMPDFLVQ